MPNILSLTGVTKSYIVGEQALEILRGITMNVRAGEFVAIMGASGSGKSTLLHLMSGLDRSTTGTVQINGNDLNDLDDSRLARLRNDTIGFIFQNFFLLNYFTALENVCLPLTYTADPGPAGHDKAKSLLRKFGMEKRLHHKPYELSGGEKQRVAIARALVNSPKIIFADEPTGALDTKTGDTIMSFLEEINRAGTTIILITHDSDVAKRAGRTLHMSDGLLTPP